MRVAAVAVLVLALGVLAIGTAFLLSSDIGPPTVEKEERIPNDRFL